MKEHPILFSGEMVEEILSGGKTQTRRVIKPQPVLMSGGIWYPSSNPGDRKNRTGLHYANEKHMRKGMPIDFCPYGQPGDNLWVRESWRPLEDDVPVSKLRPGDQIYFRADYIGEALEGQWRPSIHMPHWASRITLKIVNIRIERVQEITPIDAALEGFSPDRYQIIDFKNLWNSINAKRGYGWDVNPWVWVIEFVKWADPRSLF